MSQVFVITGMHRSGTSLVSSLLQGAGVDVGDQLISPNCANPRGYFEDVDFYEFHEKLLHARQLSYLYVGEDFDFDPSEQEVEGAQTLICQRANKPIWGWKDPRTSLFLEFWDGLLPEARYLFVYRHPVDVVLSLLRRGDFDDQPSLASGLAAWRLYNGKIKTFFERNREKCLLAPIDGLIGDFPGFCQRLEQRLELRVDPAALDQLYHAAEMHTTPLPEEADGVLQRLFPDAVSLYEQMNELADMPAAARQTTSATSPEIAELARLTASLPSPISPAATQCLFQTLVALLAPGATEQMLRKVEQSAASRQRKHDVTWLYAQQLERNNADLLTETKRQQGQLVFQQAQLMAQHAQLVEQDQVLNRQAGRIGSLEAEIGGIHATRTWRFRQSLVNAKERIRGSKTMTTHTQPSGLLHAGATIPERISQIRQLQSELRARPVTGSLRGLKKMFFQISRSTFSRQFRLNAETVDLIESVYRTLERERPLIAEQSHQLQDQAQRIAAPPDLNSKANSNGETLASCGQTQDQAKLNNIRPLHGFNSVYTAPAEMRMPERVALYSLVFGLQPRNCLEVGTFRGGSSAIICGAMDDTGFGQLACVDPMPKIDSELWSRLSHRCRLFTGPSPEILSEVSQTVGEPFDFALIDANHTYDYVRRDIDAVLPLLADEAYVLFHDGHYDGVKQAIHEAVETKPQLVDCGLLSVEPTVLHENGQSVTWAGLHLLRFQRRAG
jgi:predicted O-methyltransferase YrrM